VPATGEGRHTLGRWRRPKQLRLAGGDPDDFEARQLGPELVEAADLVDPLRRKDRVFVQMARQVQAALPPVVRALGG
jgi:hypothetical protein